MKSVHELGAVVYDLRFKCNGLLYLNRGLPGSAVYDLSAVRHLSVSIALKAGLLFAFVRAEAADVDLRETANPVQVSMSIGPNAVAVTQARLPVRSGSCYRYPALRHGSRQPLAEVRLDVTWPHRILDRAHALFNLLLSQPSC